MSAPRGNREFRNSPRGRGQPPSSRGKHTLLQRNQGGGNTGSGSNLLMSEGAGGGSEISKSDSRSQYGAPPKSAFGPSTPGYRAATPSLTNLNYGSAPVVLGTSIQAQRAQQMPKQLQQRLHEQFQEHQRLRNQPKWCVEHLTKFSPTLKMLVYYTPNKRLAALVETDDDAKIEEASNELLDDFMKYDGQSNVPMSLCSMPYLEKRSIEHLHVLHAQFPWAPYYCTLCDYHLSDLFAAEGHLPTHMKEEKRLLERQTLHNRLPPLSDAQLTAIEKVLVDAAINECLPERETKLRSSAESAIDSVRNICKQSQFNDTNQGIHLSLYGSLVSGLLTEQSDINISLKVDGENTKYFVDTILSSMEKASEWSGVRLRESPTGGARIEAVFNNEPVTIDWQNDEGVRISQLLALYNKLHEDVLPLRQIVHKWAQKCDLVAEEKLSSQHAVPRVLLDVMLIHALQQGKRLPCVHEIRKASGKDAIDQNLEDIIVEQTLSIRWNLAELFLEFLQYFSKGDIKQFLIQITCMERTSKTETKFSKKHLNVIDPIKDRPIAPLHKAFQCYFLNCFLTTYVHFRIPRVRTENGTETKALVDIDVYQTASQSPQKKKCNKGAKDEDEKEEEDEKETPGFSDRQSSGGAVVSEKCSEMTNSPKDYTTMKTSARIMCNVRPSATTPNLSSTTNTEKSSPTNIFSPFLDSLLNQSLSCDPAATHSSPVHSRQLIVAMTTKCLVDEEDDVAIDALMTNTRAEFLIGMSRRAEGNVVLGVTRTSRSRVAHTIRVGVPAARLACTFAMAEAALAPPFSWSLIKTSDEGAVVVVDASVRIVDVVEPVALRWMIATEGGDQGMKKVCTHMEESEHAIAIGEWEASNLHGMHMWKISEGLAAIGKGMMMESMATFDDEVVMAISMTKDVVVHGKLLDKMIPEDFEIDGHCIYSRREMKKIDDSGECRMDKELWSELFNEGLNTFYLAPESDGEAPIDTPLTPAPIATPAPSATSSKKKRKKKRQSDKKGTVDEMDNVEETQAGSSQHLSIGQCAAFALGIAAEIEERASTSSATAHVKSVAAPDSVIHSKGKTARRVLKLIKLDSAESSELSCDASPNAKNNEDELVALTRTFADAYLAPANSSGIYSDTWSTAGGEIDYNSVSAADNIETFSVVTEETLKADASAGSPENASISKNNASEIARSEKDMEVVQNDEDSTEKQENETAEADDDESIVLPESTSPGLQPTFEELYIDLREFDLNEITSSLDKLGEDDFKYSFDTMTLTAGFKCDQHCSACDSPKHLVSACPQLKVPPVRNISRLHWKPHYSRELDRIICMIFDIEKISNTRRKELEEVKKRLNDAIRKKLQSPFRLNAFGSSENGFGSNRSDFDVCFRYGEEFDTGENISDLQMTTILNIENALRFARFNRVMSITTAKVPIVKFACRVDSVEIEGDISYYNELALHNTQLLKRYCSWTKDKVLSKLGMFIKRWAKQCDIGDASKGSLSSYAYVILVIHFLQRLQPHPLLPVLQEMGEKKVIEVDGWDVYFCDDDPKPNWSQCKLSVGELFLQFLEYFARFDWHNQVVQIRQLNKLTKIERGWRKLMCIEDPFDLDHNLGSGISNRMFAFIMKSFVNSREVFFTLKERGTFIRQYGVSEQDDVDVPIADSFIQRYGSALLAKCRASIGGAPRDRQCFKCGRIGHFSDACPNNGSAHRGERHGGRGGRGGDGGGADRGGGRGGAVSREDRGGRGERGAKRDEHRYRDTKKERLAVQRASYQAVHEK